jgi:hypothetical protein
MVSFVQFDSTVQRRAQIGSAMDGYRRKTRMRVLFDRSRSQVQIHSLNPQCLHRYVRVFQTRIFDYGFVCHSEALIYQRGRCP